MSTWCHSCLPHLLLLSCCITWKRKKNVDHFKWSWTCSEQTASQINIHQMWEQIYAAKENKPGQCHIVTFRWISVSRSVSTNFYRLISQRECYLMSWLKRASPLIVKSLSSSPLVQPQVRLYWALREVRSLWLVIENERLSLAVKKRQSQHLNGLKYRHIFSHTSLVTSNHTELRFHLHEVLCYLLFSCFV